MVNIDVGVSITSSENTRFVVVEARSIDGDNERSVVSDSVEEVFIRVLGELSISLDGNFNSLALGGEGAVQRITEVRVVGVLVFGSETEDLGVVESDFSSSTVATT